MDLIYIFSNVRAAQPVHSASINERETKMKETFDLKKMERDFDISYIADLLRGDVIGLYQIRAPGPGRSEKDRTLFVLFDQFFEEEPFIHSFAGDDPTLCRRYFEYLIGGSIEHEFRY
jgi:hypothetical protein